MSAIFKFAFQKRKQLPFSEVIKLSKLHKKDPIFHVATTFSLKQGETRTSHGPIPHPLIFRGIVLLGGELQIDAKSSNFEIFECALYMIMPKRCYNLSLWLLGRKTI